MPSRVPQRVTLLELVEDYLHVGFQPRRLRRPLRQTLAVVLLQAGISLFRRSDMSITIHQSPLRTARFFSSASSPETVNSVPVQTELPGTAGSEAFLGQLSTLVPFLRQTIHVIFVARQPVDTDREVSAYNGHLELVCYHPLFLFNGHRARRRNCRQATCAAPKTGMSRR